MAHPKRKISKTRRDKRRTHYKAVAPTIAKDPTTGEMHLYHRATTLGPIATTPLSHRPYPPQTLKTLPYRANTFLI